MIHFINAIAKSLIENGYNDAPMYVQQVPQDFVRPSFLLSYIAGDREEVGHLIHAHNLSFQIVHFVETDEYDFTDTIKQLEEFTKIENAFKKGSILLDKKGRYAKITGYRANIRESEIYVDIDLYIYNYNPLEEEKFELATEIILNNK